ncbi:MAG: AAA family ATPase [Candidatus Omnitrophica bacterium]|nr:AAA family ATPase [Candidatus Omnitrophota bacterium]MCM8824641.1 AAA family ATPase [Candidatus Omnitrophota bacterium]
MMRIGVAGKGGTGKTTLATLIIVALLRNNHRPVLAIDADPNSNLAETLGVVAPKSLVEIVDEVTRNKYSIPSGMDKTQYLEFQIREAITEDEGFDLLVMGKTEGPGCYCYCNHLLREHMERLQRNYAFIVLDNEAGLEHLSRRTSRQLDLLFITALPDRVSLLSAQRICEMTERLELEIGEIKLVLNQYGKNFPQCSYVSTPLPVFFTLPFDEEIWQRSLNGKGLLDLPEDSNSYQVVWSNLKKILTP